MQKHLSLVHAYWINIIVKVTRQLTFYIVVLQELRPNEVSPYKSDKEIVIIPSLVIIFLDK